MEIVYADSLGQYESYNSSSNESDSDSENSGKQSWSSESLPSEEDDPLGMERHDPEDPIDAWGQGIPDWLEEGEEKITELDLYHPLSYHVLPRDSTHLATLQLIAASNYAGPINVLPSLLRNIVEVIRQLKAFIFGVDIDRYSLNHAFPKSESYQKLYQLLSKQLQKIARYQQSDHYIQSTLYIYSYRVSLNGLFCGTIKGPEQIDRLFVRWIYHVLAPDNWIRIRFRTIVTWHSRKRCIKIKKVITRRWRVEGHRVFYLACMPHISLLPLRLTQRQGKKSVILTITRTMNDNKSEGAV